MSINVAERTFSPTIPAKSYPVASGGTVSLFGIKAPATVHVVPGESGTMTVQVRVAEGAALIDADAASYAAATVFTLNSSVYELVFGAATAAGTGTISICP